VTDDALERFVREITVTPAQDGLAKDKTSLKRNIDRDHFLKTRRNTMIYPDKQYKQVKRIFRSTHCTTKKPATGSVTGIRGNRSDRIGGFQDD